jgi:hypothetical protein
MSPIDYRDTKSFGGAGRDRTDDLYVANVALSQLSYGPTDAENGVRAACSGIAARREYGCGPPSVSSHPRTRP